MWRCVHWCAVGWVLTVTGWGTQAAGQSTADTSPSVRDVQNALRKAAGYYRDQLATHGGYVYHYSLDLQQRWGEGLASKDQIWVQPPGTPTVALAYLDAHAATGDRFYLEAAVDAAHALVYGQLKSGGWQNCVDFNPRGERVSQYRNGKGGGKNNSSLDDGQSQSALLCLIRVDQALNFQDEKIHEAAQFGLKALLAAQYPNGGFPQVWTAPVPSQPVLKANYPNYDWRTEGRVKNYWDMYTLNDNVTGYVCRTLLAAYEVYQETQYLESLRRLGDFLCLAQMPAPQPGWAQQYNYAMQPIWARKFEPPAVSGDETQEAIETLLMIHAATGEEKYLHPIPSALAWLQRSSLPTGDLARYYELQSNRPLYMNRRGDTYFLTYDDTNLPDHYGWKTTSRIDELQRQFSQAQRGRIMQAHTPFTQLKQEARSLIQALDDEGRWVSTYAGERLVGQPKFSPGTKYLSSETFSRNLSTLSAYLKAANTP